MYVGDSTLYTSATTATEMTATLDKEWVARNISKTKSIVFGTNQSLNPKPQLNLVEIEQVEVTKLHGVNLDCKLSRSKHIDTRVAKMGRCLSIIKRCSALTTLSTRQVLQALVLSHLDYCSVVWSGATKRDLGKFQLAQNRAGRLALKCTWRDDMNYMHVNLSWLKVEERLTSSLLFFVRGVDMLNVPSCLFKLIPHKTCHQRSLHNLQVQNRLWEAHNTT